MTNHPKQTSDEKTLLGQLIAEISKFGGASKEDASRLAKILLPHIDSYAKRTSQPQPAEAGELREQLAAIVLSYNSEYGRYEPIVEQLEHLIASRLRLLLDQLEAVGPKDPKVPDEILSRVGKRTMDINAQWRSLLAQKRDQLCT